MAITMKLVTIDCPDPRALAQFWASAMDLTVAEDFDGEYLILVPADKAADQIGLGLQRVAEPKVGKNRLHLDFASLDRELEVSRLVGLGASLVEHHEVPGMSWTVLTDPAGNEFCVS